MIKNINDTKTTLDSLLATLHSLLAHSHSLQSLSTNFSVKSLANLALKLVFRFYKIIISPLLPHSCRFYPTCSHFAYLSFRHSTPFSAFIATLWRILRCQPFCKGGFDYPIISTKLESTYSRSAVFSTNLRKCEGLPHICVWLVPLKSQIHSKIDSKINSKADSALFQKMIAKKKTSKYIIIPN